MNPKGPESPTLGVEAYKRAGRAGGMDCLAAVQAFCLAVAARKRRRARRDGVYRAARVALAQLGGRVTVETAVQEGGTQGEFTAHHPPETAGHATA